MERFRSFSAGVPSPGNSSTNWLRKWKQAPEKLKPSDRQLLYLHAGEAAKHAGDSARAAELWRRGAAIDADPKLTREIKAALGQR